MEMKKVTAIVLNYNSFTDCAKCLSFLRKQDYPELSIIVVDNCSTVEGEEERLRKICGESELIMAPNNGGFSAGNNIGLREAVKHGSDWMLVINPDVEIRDERYISSVMEQIPNWSQAVVVGTDVLLPSGAHQNPLLEGSAWDEIFWMKETLKRLLKKRREQNNENTLYETAVTGYCEKVSGCCFFIQSAYLKEFGFLDENVFLYCEEPILAKSVLANGKRELFIKEVTAYHEHYQVEKSGSSKQRMSLFFKSREYYIMHYSGYRKFEKNLAILSRRIEAWLWRHR